ncbi:MAG: addiction module protein [Flavobacteriales bacterium]|nr:addiction module protein [Flavobacteriales bacterium]
MKVTLDIQDSKAAAFLNFIKSLDFITVKEESGFVLSDNHISILEERKADYESGKSQSLSWEEVKDKARKRK